MDEHSLKPISKLTWPKPLSDIIIKNNNNNIIIINNNNNNNNNNNVNLYRVPKK